MTTDPRLVKAALPVTTITYEEAAELAFFGAEVLHPIAMQPAIRSNIPVRVKNSYNPKAVGTVIIATRDKAESLMTAITAKNNVQVIDISSTGNTAVFAKYAVYLTQQL
jgi:aspartate kinase